MTDETFTEEEASAFSSKLDAWSQTLSERERTILHGLLAHAVNGAATTGDEADEDVAGFAFNLLPKVEMRTGEVLSAPFSTRDLSQVALAPLTGSHLQIKWDG